jgi:hypothetical protein
LLRERFACVGPSADYGDIVSVEQLVEVAFAEILDEPRVNVLGDVQFETVRRLVDETVARLL